MFEISRTCRQIGSILVQIKLFDLLKEEIQPVRQDQVDQHSWTNRYQLPAGEYMEVKTTGPTHSRQVFHSLLVISQDGSEQTKILDPVPIFL